MNAAPYLCFAGIEVASDLRTLTYLRRGRIDDSRFQAGLSDDFQVESGYSDIYSDLYNTDQFSPSNLACYCSAYNEEPYISPLDDEADWYEPNRIESADFLGILLTKVELAPVIARSVTARAMGGAVIGPLRLRQRVLQCEGMMLARTPQGMSWGERWLTDVLSGSYCEQEGCVDDDLILLPACPEEDSTEPERFFRTLKQVGIADGPIFQQADDSVPECKMQSVSFQLVSGLPWLYAPAEPMITQETLNANNPDTSVMLSTDDWVGDASTVITISAAASGALAPRQVRIQAKVAIGGECPVVSSGINPCFDVTVSLERGDSIIIDSAARRVLRFDATTKRHTSGLANIDFEGLFNWLDIAPCTRLCVTFTRISGTTAVSIDQVNREL